MRARERADRFAGVAVEVEALSVFSALMRLPHVENHSDTRTPISMTQSLAADYESFLLPVKLLIVAVYSCLKSIHN